MTNSYATVRRALDSLGKGFDLASDFRLKYCKGKDSLVSLTQDQTKQLSVPGFGQFNDVSADIKCGKGDRTRYQSGILDFTQVCFSSLLLVHLTFVNILEVFNGVFFSFIVDVRIHEPEMLCSRKDSVGLV